MPSSSDAPPVGPYAPIVRAGDLLICSGQLGLKDGDLVAGGVEAELTQAFVNLTSVLASEGATLDHVVKTLVFLLDMDEFAAMNAVYVEHFGDHRPARSAVAVAGLPRGACVEIEAWAYLPPASH